MSIRQIFLTFGLMEDSNGMALGLRIRVEVSVQVTIRPILFSCICVCAFEDITIDRVGTGYAQAYRRYMWTGGKGRLGRVGRWTAHGVLLHHGKQR